MDIKAEILEKLRQNPDQDTHILLFELRNALSTVISGTTLIHDLDCDEQSDKAVSRDVSQIVLEYAERMQYMLDALQEFHDIQPDKV